MDNASLLNSPWAITPEHYQSLAAYDMNKLSTHDAYERASQDSEDSISFKEWEAKMKAEFEEQLEVSEEGVGVLRINGTMMPNPSLVDRLFFGACDTVRLTNLVNLAAESPQIQNLILVMDTPGGMVVGTPELASAIRGFNEKGKTSYSYNRVMCASAGAWVSSQCSYSYASESSINGSIGVIRPHVDMTKRYEDLGVNMQIFRGGAQKVPGAYNTALSESQAAHIQEGVNATHSEFQAAVNHHRSVSIENMQGQTFSGNQALENGLIDAVMNDFSDVFESACESAERMHQMAANAEVDNNAEIMENESIEQEQGDLKESAAEQEVVDTPTATGEEAAERIEKLEVVAEEQAEDIADFDQAVECLNDRVAELEEAAEAHEGQVDDLNAELDSIKAEHADLQDNFDEKVEERASELADELAEGKAARIAAQAGTSTPPKVSEGDQVQDDEMAAELEGKSEGEQYAILQEAFLKIEDPADRRAFWVEHSMGSR